MTYHPNPGLPVLSFVSYLTSSFPPPCLHSSPVSALLHVLVLAFVVVVLVVLVLVVLVFVYLYVLLHVWELGVVILCYHHVYAYVVVASVSRGPNVSIQHR